MKEFFSFSLIDVISVIFSLLAIIVAIIIYKRNTKIKRLQYKILCHSKLINNDLTDNKLQVMYDNNPVNDIEYIELMITNNGTIPIESKDIERNISIILNEEACILSAEIKETKPESLHIKLECHSNKLSLERILINPDDIIIIKMIVCQYYGNLQIDCRISGVKSINQIEEKKLFSSLFIVIFLTATAISAICELLNIGNGSLVIIKTIAIGSIVAVLNTVLIRAGRKDQALMTTIAAIIVIILLIINLLSLIFKYINNIY